MKKLITLISTKKKTSKQVAQEVMKNFQKYQKTKRAVINNIDEKK